jgi:hypothetical protein
MKPGGYRIGRKNYRYNWTLIVYLIVWYRALHHSGFRWVGSWCGGAAGTHSAETVDSLGEGE